MKLRQNPHLIEINARTFLNRLSAKYNEPFTLASVPNAEWNSLAQTGFNLVWLMGVWKQSPEARRLTLASPGLRQEFDRVLPGWTEDDAVASPYAIHDYTLDPTLGSESDLATVRERLNRLGIGLALDFVPNHVSIDHPWTTEHPSFFVQAPAFQVADHPKWFFTTPNGQTIAHGRDPYYEAWNDTAQINFFSDEARDALVTALIRVTRNCDAVRCDMAMLALNGVFEWVWGEVLGPVRRPKAEFWEMAISAVRKSNPDLVFMAEVYWGLERTLRDMGFRFTYDKALYDHFRWDPAPEVFEHVKSDGFNLETGAHFLENHDEPRAVATFGRERSMAAAVMQGTMPGLRFYQDGQLEGKRIRIPVQLGREPVEFPDPEISLFYRSLLRFTQSEILHTGAWRPLEVTSSWPGNESHRNIVAWEWKLRDERAIVTVNYAQSRSQAWVRPERPASPGRVGLEDVLTGTTYVREADELSSKGLYVDLGPYRSHLMHSASF